MIRQLSAPVVKVGVTASSSADVAVAKVSIRGVPPVFVIRIAIAPQLPDPPVRVTSQDAPSPDATLCNTLPDAPAVVPPLMEGSNKSVNPVMSNSAVPSTLSSPCAHTAIKSPSAVSVGLVRVNELVEPDTLVEAETTDTTAMSN